MTERFVTRTSDGETIDLKEEEAEHADLTANAKRVILTDAAGDAITSLNPLPVDTELTLDGNVIIDNVSVYATDISDSTTTSFALVDSSGHQQVDVLTMPSVTVSATNLDIRDLTSASDSIEVIQDTASDLKATVTQSGTVDVDVTANTIGLATSAKQLEDGHNVVITDGIVSGQMRLDGSTEALNTIEYEHHEVHAGSSYFTEGHTTLGDGDPDPVNFYASFTTPAGAKYGHFVWTVTSSGITDIKVYEGANGGMGNGSRGVIHANNRNVNCWSGSHTPAGASATVLTDTNQSWTPDALIGMQVFNQTDGSSGFITDNDATTVTVTALAGGTGNNWEQNDVYEINNSQMIVNVDHDAATTAGLLFGDTAFGGTGFKADIGGGTTRANELIAKPDTTYLIHIASGSETNIVTFSLHWYEHTDKN